MSILFGRANFKFVRGTRWDDNVTLTEQSTGEPVDLTGITGMTMRLRETIDDEDVLMELTVAGGKLVIVDAAAGEMGIRVNSATTWAMPENNHEKARYVYDAVIERSSGEYEAAIGGTVTVLPQITRPLGD